MKDLRLINLIKTAVVLVVALLATLAVGMFAGYPAYPELTRQRIQAIDEYNKTHPVQTPDERDAFYDGLSSNTSLPTATNPAVSILMWYPLVLCISALILLFALRPRGIYFLTTYSLASVVLIFVAGFLPAVLLVSAGLAYIALWRIFLGLRDRASAA